MDRQLIPDITTTASTVIVFGYKESTILVLGCLGNDRIKVNTYYLSAAVFIISLELTELTKLIDFDKYFIIFLSMIKLV